MLIKIFEKRAINGFEEMGDVGLDEVVHVL
jgi:hypothetical protein